MIDSIRIELAGAARLPDILSVQRRAFGREAEPDLCDKLIRSGRATHSLVAVDGERVIGHILFSAIRLFPRKDGVRAAALGPVAVDPDFQRRGVGSALIERGLADCFRLDLNAVFVLGEIDFYARFGFASIYTVTCEFDAPEGAFMAAELKEGALSGVLAKALYEPEFSLCV